MNSKLEALIAAYQIKPKKLKKKPSKAIQKSFAPNHLEHPVPIRSSRVATDKKRNLRENYSVQPKRSDSNLSLGRYLNTSIDEDIEKLDSLTVKNSSARLDWISVKQRMIELSVKKKLKPIAEIDESGADFLYFQRKSPENSFDFGRKYESRVNLELKDRIKSLNNLLLVD